MATSSSQQYPIPHYEFVNGSPDDFKCPVCFDAIYGAKKTTCCGHHLCETCSERLTGSLCPVCKLGPLKTQEDEYFRKKLDDLKVYCPHKGERHTYKKQFYDPEYAMFWMPSLSDPITVTCKFQCELGDIQSHLDKDCPLQLVTCKYKCDTTDLRRFEVEYHEKNCRMRPHKCRYCSYEASAFQIEKHFQVCPKIPVECPNRCMKDKILRESIVAHLTHCKLHKVSCEFAYAGCTVTPTRKNYESHLQESTNIHLKLLGIHCAHKDKEMEDMKMRLAELETKLC